MKTLHYSIITIIVLLVSSMTIFASAQVPPVPIFETAYFKDNDGTYPISYRLVNATLTTSVIDLPAKELIFGINATSDGQLTVILPREIIDSKYGFQDTSYFASIYDIRSLGEPMRIIPQELNEKDQRIIQINFSSDITNIAIAGTWFVENNSTNPLHWNSFGSWSPLQQFNKGVMAEDVICNKSLALVLQAENGLPACVKYTTANTLIERGWAKKVVQNITSNETTVVIPINSSDIHNGFTFSPSVAKIVIGENNTIQWINMDSVTNDITSDTESFKQILIESGYAQTLTFDKTGIYGYHSVIHPWLKGVVIVTLDPLSVLKNDAGMITLENKTYYFETPHYANDASSHPVQISVHGVDFALFPSGFRGGLPSSCGTQYYWTDAKFSDDSSELLHIFAGSQCPTPPLPTFFSNHTNPQAGLTFYDGKMKLLVSANVTNSSGN